MNEMSDTEKKQQIRKSQVRVVVTYFMTGAYVTTAIGLIAWLMWLDKSELGDWRLLGRRLHHRDNHRVLVRVARRWQRVRASRPVGRVRA